MKDIMPVSKMNKDHRQDKVLCIREVPGLLPLQWEGNLLESSWEELLAVPLEVACLLLLSGELAPPGEEEEREEEEVEVVGWLDELLL